MAIDPSTLSIKNFTYDLPEDRIAHYPAEKRDASKLLIYRDGKIKEKFFYQLSDEIPVESLLVFNNTRVVRARLLLQRISGATVEIFCTDAADSSLDFVKLLQSKSEVQIRAFIGNGKRWKGDEALQLKIKSGNEEILLHATREGNAGEQSIVKLSWTPFEFSFAEIIDAAGKIPLPPYLNRDEEAVDEERYQTIYAAHKGSVAAPTAGLHFTPAVMKSLEANNIIFENVTLHVGAGTFKPVKAEQMSGHDMHREQIIIPRSLIEKILLQKDAPVIAVGTTALRTLESIYWFGKQLITQPGRHFDSLFVGQWEPYEDTPAVPLPVALRAILDWMQENNHTEVKGFTQILIAPGYSFKVVDALITNFHQPQSTLLLLVSAFIGDGCKQVYDYALKNDFRFLSYGDSSLLWRM
ncbi:S-adenosylmethionine:tRNA ribosyltransferase-isomerase [soil metagenome]